MRDKILQLIQTRGPVLPADIRSALKIDSIFIGAYLSELRNEGKIKASLAKVGGSPLYYVSGQESQLEQLHRYLSEKQKQAVIFLKEKQVVRDADLDEPMRASLRELKDFAIPLKVNKEQLFWKYHLITHEQAIKHIKTIVQGNLAERRILAEQETPSRIEEAIPTMQSVENTGTVETQTTITERSPTEQITVQKIPQKIEEECLTIEKPEIKRISVIERSRERVARKIQALRELQLGESLSAPAEPSQKKMELKEQKESKEQKEMLQEVLASPEEVADELMQKFVAYSKEKDITIKEYSIIRAEREIDIIASIPSVIGKVDYFCAVRNKKKCNEGDVSSAVIKAQSRNLPTLFISTGDVTKKTFAMIGKEFKQLIIQKL